MIALLSKVAEHCVGLDFSEAKRKIERAGAICRVVEKDGQSFMLDIGFDDKRINIVLHGKIVNSAEIG